MEYTALYRKFRPLKFNEIVGQEHIVKTLKNEIINDRIGHAYLFNGGRGTGKTSAAKILARAINCLNPKDGEPCNECPICKAALDGSLTDIVEMDAASNNGVEDIRAIRDEVNFLPTVAKYRVYIIDEVHMLSTGAFNALLKTLEEPPLHVKFILATTEPQKLPSTILSRCQRFDFKKIDNENIEKRLDYVCNESKINITMGAKKIISILAEGAMRDALSILERCMQEETEITEDIVKELVGIPKIESINKLAKSIIDKNTDLALEVIEDIVKEGKDITNFLWELIKYIKDILLAKMNYKLEIYSEDEKSEIINLSKEIEKEELVNIIFELSNLQNNMKWSSQKLIMFQVEIIKLCNRNFKLNQSNSVNNISIDEKEVNNLNYKINKLEKQISLMQNSIKLGSSEKKTNKIGLESQNYPKAEIKESTSVKLGKPVDNWNKIIGNLKEEGKISLSSTLKGSLANEINDMTIGINFENGLTPFTKEILQKTENMNEIVKQVSMEYGNPMRVVLVDNNSEINSKQDILDPSNMGLDIPINIID